MENHHENSWVNQLFFYICTHHHYVPNIAGCPIFLLPKTIIRFPRSKKTSSTWAMTSGPLIQLRKTSYCVVYTHFIPTLSPHFTILS
jgi:hypothetical protein